VSRCIDVLEAISESVNPMGKNAGYLQVPVRTSTLEGSALDWAVAIASGWQDASISDYADPDSVNHVSFRQEKSVDGTPVCAKGELWTPSLSWHQAGPLIEREQIRTWFDDDTSCWRSAYSRPTVRGTDRNRDVFEQSGPSLLVCAMRSFVCATLGDEIDVPVSLLPREGREAKPRRCSP
jgi:hypothetical protein